MSGWVPVSHDPLVGEAAAAEAARWRAVDAARQAQPSGETQASRLKALRAAQALAKARPTPSATRPSAGPVAPPTHRIQPPVQPPGHLLPKGVQPDGSVWLSPQDVANLNATLDELGAP